jgi:methylmalonyl-CoA/ethylmalonyl-CoA epimerase
MPHGIEKSLSMQSAGVICPLPTAFFAEDSMLNRIAVVGVPACDVVRAAHFYRDTLGLQMLPHHSGPPHFKVGGTFLAVFERGESFIASSAPLVAFEVEDIEADVAALMARGVVFEGGVRQDGEARWTAFRDSEGNELELIQFVAPAA